MNVLFIRKIQLNNFFFIFIVKNKQSKTIFLVLKKYNCEKILLSEKASNYNKNFHCQKTKNNYQKNFVRKNDKLFFHKMYAIE